MERFRKEVLDDELLEPDRAHRLLASRAARLLTLEQFLKWEIPVVDHTCELVEYDHGPVAKIDHRATLWVDPPGTNKTVRYAYSADADLDTRCVIQGVNNKVMVPPNQGPAGMPLVPLIRGDYLYPPLLWPGSVVGRLYELSEILTNEFDWPDTEAAAWFVLTGQAPEVHPLNARWEMKGGSYLNPQWRIRLTIAPWMPVKEVEKAYRRMQRRILPGRNELRGPGVFEVASFVWKQERLRGYRRPLWRVLCERWNKNPENAKFETYNNFRLYCMRGVETVTNLNFSWPQLDDKVDTGGLVQQLEVIEMSSLYCRLQDAPADTDVEGNHGVTKY